jgi:hypothetical protein
MKKPQPVRQLPSSVTKIDADGNETHEAAAWHIMPPPADRCQICAVKHEPGEPHNAHSMYYQMTFTSMIGRAPTWADALAHCGEKTKLLWTAELQRRGAWTEPPAGEEPVAHHGIDQAG